MENLTVREGIDEGIKPLEVLLTAQAGLQDAVLLTVTRLGGGELGKPGTLPSRVHDRNALRSVDPVATHKVSVIVEKSLQPVNHEAYGEYFDIHTMGDPRTTQLANGQTALLEQALDKPADMFSGLPAGINVWLGDTVHRRQAGIHKESHRNRNLAAQYYPRIPIGNSLNNE